MTPQEKLQFILTAIATDSTLLILVRLSATRSLMQMSEDQLDQIISLIPSGE